MKIKKRLRSRKGQRGYLPGRVRITVTIKNGEGRELKLSTEARIQMSEQLLLSPT